MRICRSIQKTKVANELLVEEENQNNDNEMNNKKGDGNYMDSAFVKDNDKTQPSGTTEDSQK